MEYRTSPWPNKGDKLFTSRTDGSESMIAGISVSFGSFADSFKAATNLIVAHINEFESFERDRLIFPVIYLNRHFVELMLKAIIEVGDELNQTQRLKENMHHSLLDLWSVVKELIVSGHLCTSQETATVEGIIREFADADPLSFSFRYPVDKALNKLPPQWQHVSVNNLQDTMNKLSNFLKDVLYTLYQAAGGAESIEGDKK